MIEPRHSLPATEEYKMLTHPQNPWGVRESENLAGWSNVYSIGWIAGVYYKTLKFVAALRDKGMSEEQIKEIVSETVDDIDYGCLPQIHMLTGQPLPKLANCPD